MLSFLRIYLWIDGRTGRREWWSTMVLCLMLGWQLDVMSIFALPMYGKGYGIDGIIRMGLSVLLFWIDFASTIRRVHDRGKSGWSALPFAFPGLGWMWMVIECGLLPSQKGRNRYGPVPGSIEEQRERPSLPDLLASFGEHGARSPWSTPAERPRSAGAAVRPGTVTRVAESSQTRGKTILILVAATILGLAVATYMADGIAVHQSGKLSTTP